jgi:homeobox protein cut-like
MTDEAEFKKLPDDTEKLTSIKVLLKAYQGEIDSLTRRSKMSETSFLNLYKLLSDAPDPYPLLDAAVDQTVKVAEARMLESELARLREENGDLKRQVGEMGSVEDKRKKAEAKVESMEEKVSSIGVKIWLSADSQDGRPNSREGHPKGERAECRIR